MSKKILRKLHDSGHLSIIHYNFLKLKLKLMDLPKKLNSSFYQLHWSIYTKKYIFISHQRIILKKRKNILPLQKSLQITFSSSITFRRELYFHKNIVIQLFPIIILYHFTIRNFNFQENTSNNQLSSQSQMQFIYESIHSAICFVSSFFSIYTAWNSRTIAFLESKVRIS